jgi:cell division protein FtsB
VASSLPYTQQSSPVHQLTSAGLYYDDPIGPARAHRTTRYKKQTSYVSLASQWIVFACLLFATVHIVHAGWVYASELTALLSQRNQLSSYHQVLSDTQEQLKTNIKFYSSRSGQESLIRNQLNLVSSDEILVRFN